MNTILKEGAKAPEFTAPDQNGNLVKLSSFIGNRVALYFYPKDNTPTCTTQACNFRDNDALLKKAGIKVIGVSIDTEKSHKKFEVKYQLPFTLIADTDRKIVENYGVWGMKKFMGKEYMGVHRTTFLINEKGIIDHIIEKVNSKDHSAQILEIWK